MHEIVNLLRNGYAEPNTYKFRMKNYCYKLQCTCPSIVRYDDNNITCDLALYTPTRKDNMVQ